MKYKCFAEHGATLFFVMSQLSALCHMYQYSVSSFLVIFHRALAEAKACSDSNERLKNLSDKLTALTYEFVGLGTFEKHKLLFSFKLTTELMLGNKTLPAEELMFYLNGSSSIVQQEDNPYEWMNQSSWKDVKQLIGYSELWSELP